MNRTHFPLSLTKKKITQTDQIQKPIFSRQKIQSFHKMFTIFYRFTSKLTHIEFSI